MSLRTRLVKPTPPRSDGFIESLGASVIHFPYQAFVRTSLPSIFEPWDLQHRHLPEFFTPLERRTRDGIYSSACLEATAVAVGSDWVRRDVITQYRIPSSKLFVVRRGPPPRLPSDTPDQVASSAVKARFGLPDRFLFCPANTWPHKNHLRLLDALAQLRDRDGLLPLDQPCGDFFGDRDNLFHLNSVAGFVSPMAGYPPFQSATARLRQRPVRSES